MRISDWSSDVCSSDLRAALLGVAGVAGLVKRCGDQQGWAIRAMWIVAIAARGLAFQDRVRRWPVDFGALGLEIGRASCRVRVGQYVWISVVAVYLKTK